MPLLACVTGADGFIATRLVATLLARGVRVRGTVIDEHAASAAFLRTLPGAAASLSLSVADLLQEGAYDAAVAGCDGACGGVAVVRRAGCGVVGARMYASALFRRPSIGLRSARLPV
jgi:nucleoside-diphosphate-sugar epimerase